MSDKVARARLLAKRRVQSFRNKKLKQSENSSSTAESESNCDLPLCPEFNSDINSLRFDELKNDNLFDDSFQYAGINSETDSDLEYSTDSDSDDLQDDVASTIISTTLLILELRRWALKFKVSRISLDSASNFKTLPSRVASVFNNFKENELQVM